MTIINKTFIAVTINNRIYEMEFPAESPAGEVHDALVQMRGIVLDIMKSRQEQEAKEPEVVEVVD